MVGLNPPNRRQQLPGQMTAGISRRHRPLCTLVGPQRRVGDSAGGQPGGIGSYRLRRFRRRWSLNRDDRRRGNRRDERRAKAESIIGVPPQLVGNRGSQILKRDPRDGSRFSRHGPPEDEQGGNQQHGSHVSVKAHTDPLGEEQGVEGGLPGLHGCVAA